VSTDRDEPLPPLPRQRWRELVPRRSLARVVVLLGLLIAVLTLRQRSASIIHILDNLMAPAPAQQAPRVRFAPPPAAPGPRP
jgi:hypothetical protein